MSEKEISIHDVTPEIAGMYAHWIYRASLVDLDNVDVNSVLQTNIFWGPSRKRLLWRQ